MGRPAGAGTVTYGASALRLLDNGYAPIPIRLGTKVPALTRWSRVEIDEDAVEGWSARFPACGAGLRTGDLVGLDIDLLDPDLAHGVFSEAEKRLGATLVRVGQWPKRLMLYQTSQPFAKLQVPGIEVLGAGQQFVAFGMHPAMQQPYTWITGDSPLDVCLNDLPVVEEDQVRQFLGEVSVSMPPQPHRPSQPRHRQSGTNVPKRDGSGLVTDGRDAWLSSIAYHAVHDAVANDGRLDAAVIADGVWDRFAATTDLSRPCKDGGRTYLLQDARRKVADKLMLHEQGRLPPRISAVPEPAYKAPDMLVDDARAMLDRTLSHACTQIAGWHQGEGRGPAPQIGIQATVGLGKSTAARRHLYALHEHLKRRGAPARIAIFTPSHALAEETAGLWREMGGKVAVLRGYERNDPASGELICRDLDAVRLAVTVGADVSESVCYNARGQVCRFYDGCLKQQNRREVASADVVVAPYDALFTGFASDMSEFGAVLIDERFWGRAIETERSLKVEMLVERGPTGDHCASGCIKDHSAALMAMRQKIMEALLAIGPGIVCGEALSKVGLTPDICRAAAELESKHRMPRLHPGMSLAERRDAATQSALRQISVRRRALFHMLAQLLDGEDAQGQLLVHDPDPRTGLHDMSITSLAKIHLNLRGKPVLHLDATLRPEIAKRILTRLEVTRIEAAAPHMRLRLVTGRFSKSALIEDSGARPEENGRRRNHMSEVVEYVRWHALTVGPKATLVVTYKDCEPLFQGIPNVLTAHFNAIAGLDTWRDVAQIIVIGRPLPASDALAQLGGGLFGQEVSGVYENKNRAVRMRDDSGRAVRVLCHSDPSGEQLRAAICDDELVQAIGRARGANRSAGKPLMVHVLADVALPLVHDEVTTWDLAAPDLLRKMLVRGVAVDSPADAAVLHPTLFENEKQAQKAFERAGFKRQTSYKDPIRQMSLKSAAYRRVGRGRGWQRAWWIDGALNDAAARAVLEREVGQLAGWH